MYYFHILNYAHHIITRGAGAEGAKSGGHR